MGSAIMQKFPLFSGNALGYVIEPLIITQTRYNTMRLSVGKNNPCDKDCRFHEDRRLGMIATKKTDIKVVEVMLKELARPLNKAQMIFLLQILEKNSVSSYQEFASLPKLWMLKDQLGCQECTSGWKSKHPQGWVHSTPTKPCDAAGCFWRKYHIENKEGILTPDMCKKCFTSRCPTCDAKGTVSCDSKECPKRTLFLPGWFSCSCPCKGSCRKTCPTCAKGDSSDQRDCEHEWIPDCTRCDATGEVAVPCKACDGNVFIPLGPGGRRFKPGYITDSHAFTAEECFEIYNYYRQKWLYIHLPCHFGRPVTSGVCGNCEGTGRVRYRSENKFVACPSCEIALALYKNSHGNKKFSAGEKVSVRGWRKSEKERGWREHGRKFIVKERTATGYTVEFHGKTYSVPEEFTSVPRRRLGAPYMRRNAVGSSSLPTDHDAPHGLFIFVPILMFLILIYLILRKPAAKWNSVSSSRTDRPPPGRNPLRSATELCHDIV